MDKVRRYAKVRRYYCVQKAKHSELGTQVPLPLKEGYCCVPANAVDFLGR